MSAPRPKSVARRPPSRRGIVSESLPFEEKRMSGLFGLVILALDIFAGYNVVTSSVDTPKKIGWILLIVVLPVIGFIIWALAGPRGKKLF
jgi:hypothetical protein